MNRGEIIAAVKDYLNRPNLSDTSVSTMISCVEGEMNSILREHPSNIRRTSMIQPAGNAILPMPYDMLQVITLRDANGQLGQYPPDARATAESVGRSYIMRGDCAELFPAPAADTEYFLDYYAAIKALSGNTDSNWVSVYHPDIYIYGTLRESAVYLKDDPRLALWSQEFLRRIDGIVAQGWGKNIATAPRVRLG